MHGVQRRAGAEQELWNGRRGQITEVGPHIYTGYRIMCQYEHLRATAYLSPAASHCPSTSYATYLSSRVRFLICGKCYLLQSSHRIVLLQTPSFSMPKNYHCCLVIAEYSCPSNLSHCISQLTSEACKARCDQFLNWQTCA